MIGPGLVSDKRGRAMSRAARHGSVEEFLACYQPRAARKWTDDHGNTLLHDALCHPDPVSRVRIAGRLLADGADASALSSGGYTTAHLLVPRVAPAHSPGHAAEEAALLATLCEGGCDVNHAHPREGTPLEALAARFKHSDEALAPYYAVLLARPDLDLLAPSRHDRSPWESIRRWRPRRDHLVGLLEERLRREGRLPEESLVSLARWAGADRVLAAYRPDDVASVDPGTGWSLLHAVLDNPDVEARLTVAHRLLDDGADATATTPEGLTPAHVLLRGHGERDAVREAGLLQRLLDLGADPNAVARKVGTPLNSLAAESNLDEESRMPLYDVLRARLEERFPPGARP
ncbi:ankyrin repeat domain-containing protein [Nocardioides solisilvae]|uniref:ankyrin repeat domain-containing protein n=1 Tax=Nocardioides solisilvae TaxID=1542435 RepID=UPI000D746D2A|nr:ankyrin repeat domain-containing protein [Nocardioides solisilvae]